MKKLMACLSVMFLVGCAKVEPGYVGILVNQYGKEKGVQDVALKTGLVWYNPFTEDIYKFPTFLQSAVWTQSPYEGSPNDDSISFNSFEGASVNADISIAYSFEAEKVPQIFVEFRKSADEITRGYMRHQVRDAFQRLSGKMKITDIFGLRKQELLEGVKDDLNRHLGPKGFQFDTISFVGALRVDGTVSASINAVIEATQKAIEAENKVRQSQAEAQQQIAKADGEAQSMLKLAQAQAESNQIIAKSLTPELVQWQLIQRWNGITPQVTGGAMPLLDFSLQGKNK